MNQPSLLNLISIAAGLAERVKPSQRGGGFDHGAPR